MSAADDRGAFEAWCLRAAKVDQVDDGSRYGTLDLERHSDGSYRYGYIADRWEAWQAAIAAEREAAAKVCDERAKKHRETFTDDIGESYQLGHATDEANACAAAIRARGAS